MGAGGDSDRGSVELEGADDEAEGPLKSSLLAQDKTLPELLCPPSAKFKFGRGASL